MLDMKENQVIDYETERAMLDAWKERDKSTWLALIAGVGAVFTLYPQRIYVAGSHALVTTENLPLPSYEGDYVYGIQPDMIINLEIEIDPLEYYNVGRELHYRRALNAWWNAGDVAVKYAPNIEMLSENFYSDAAFFLRQYGRRVDGVDELDFREVTAKI